MAHQTTAVRGRVKASPAATATTKTTAERRAERQEAARRKLLDAAARVIARYGYSGCSVARVTARAKIAHGTFYLYFRSQQELFDAVLPFSGRDMLASIARAIGIESDPMEVERRGFTANVQYTIDHPYMNRVLYEAKLFAPKAYDEYHKDIIEAYVRSLRRTLKPGKLSGASEDELSLVATMLVSARTSLLFKITSQTAKSPEFIQQLIETYLKFVRTGLMFESDGTAVPIAGS